MSQEISRANQFIAEQAQNVLPDYRHHYHLMAPIGWINDPNGFIYYEGAYHLFYQHYPYDSKWGPMHWGHAKSTDLMHWEHLPVALAPDETYDADGCYSGSAIAHDGKLYLIYTGHVEADGMRREVQCLAVSEDGITFKKYSGNPIISEVQLEGVDADIADFRDPKIFEHEGLFYCVVASKTSDNLGQILLFKSENLTDWTFFSVLLTGTAQQGTMWECPDFFQLDGKDVLILSPIAMPIDGFAYENINSTLAIIGQMDWTTGQLTVENTHEIDGGLDFYAPQTCLSPQGQRIMVAWMQMWQRTIPTHDLGHHWAGSMTLPRYLSVHKLRLVQKPVNINMVSEVRPLSLRAGQTLSLPTTLSESCYLQVDLEVSQVGRLELDLLVTETSALSLSYDAATQVFTFDRTGFGLPIVGQEVQPLNKRSLQLTLDPSEHLRLDIYRDTASIEIFLNGGVSLTSTFYASEKSQTATLTTDGDLTGQTTYAEIQ